MIKVKKTIGEISKLLNKMNGIGMNRKIKNKQQTKIK